MTRPPRHRPKTRGAWIREAHRDRKARERYERYGTPEERSARILHALEEGAHTKAELIVKLGLTPSTLGGPLGTLVESGQVKRRGQTFELRKKP